MVRFIGSRIGGEAGQFPEKNIKLHGAALNRYALHLLLPFWIGRLTEHAQGLARVGVGDYGAGANTLAALKKHAFTGQNLGHRNSRGDGCAGFARGIAKIERNHPHAALYVAPHSRPSAQPA